MKTFAVLLLAVLLSGCVRPQQVGGTPEGVWVKDPMISIGNPDTVAQEHCARYGKTAVPASKMVGNQGDWRQSVQRSQFLPIYAYDCK